MTFDQWKLPQRALALNIVGLMGLVIGILSGGKASPDLYAPLAISLLACLNFLFLVVRPRFVRSQELGERITFVEVAIRVVREKPLITLLVALQLVGTSRALSTAISVLRDSKSSYVSSLPNAATMSSRMVVVSIVLAGVSLLWLLGAIGLWRGRTWAWWLAVILNGLALGVTGVLQLLVREKLLLDVFALLAIMVLLLPSVRALSRRAA